MKLTRSSLLKFVVLSLGVCFALATSGDLTTFAAQQKPATFKATKFKPTCAKPSYPAPEPSKLPSIDLQCGLAGYGTGPEAHKTTQQEYRN